MDFVKNYAKEITYVCMFIRVYGLCVFSPGLIFCWLIFG